MTRTTSRRLAILSFAVLAATTLGGCASPFSDHGEDVLDVQAAKFHDAHRKFDRYIWGLDWDDPNHQWHDESYASGPMHH